MEWLEITLKAPAADAEIVAEILSDYGHQGVSMDHLDIDANLWDGSPVPEPEWLQLRAYIPVDETTPDSRARLEADLIANRLPEPSYRRVAETDWAEAWKANYHTERIGQRIIVRPLWESYDPKPDDIVIALDPGMAFGTGTHPTTQLCLIALENMIRSGHRMLDLGCGSGILSIAAAKLGARDILALDIDPIAAKVTDENIAQNGVAEHITAQQGSLDTVLRSARRFDVLAANIIAKVIIEMCEQGLGQVVRPGGKAIFSGVIAEQLEDVQAALRATGLQPGEVTRDGEWVGIAAYRPEIS